MGDLSASGGCERTCTVNISPGRESEKAIPERRRPLFSSLGEETISHIWCLLGHIPFGGLMGCSKAFLFLQISLVAAKASGG